MVETEYSIVGLPVHLALLSDFHNRANSDILSSLKRRRPDLILIAGDVFYSNNPLINQAHVLPFLDDCVSVAPTYLSLGNHEKSITTEEIKEMEKTGVTVLDNEWVVIRQLTSGYRGEEIKEKTGVTEIVIGGLTSRYRTKEKNRNQAVTEINKKRKKAGEIKGVGEWTWLSSFTSVPGYHILLSHHPEYWNVIRRTNIELMVSGHAHGGQWRFLGRGLYAPGQGWMPKYTKGVYEGRLVVSAGLTNTTGLPRLFNPTEVVYIRPATTITQ